jgi:RimJ/RimL family protein N-acetyltransferase
MDYLPVDYVISTTRCRLRCPQADDAERLLSAFTMPNFPRDLPLGRLNTIEQVLRWTEGCKTRWESGSGYTWTSERRLDALIVGQVTVIRMAEDTSWALAFWTHPDSWGQGYATEAVTAVVDFTFEMLGAERIWAGASHWNTASRRVLAKIGMAYVGETAEGFPMNGKPVPVQEYELLRQQWLSDYDL